jgi:hypothetical protein
VNGGSDVLQYVHTESGDTVCSLDRLAEEYQVTERYFEAALAPSRCGASLFAWPLSLHRINTLLVNLDVYEQLRTQAARDGQSFADLASIHSVTELFELLEHVQALGLKSAQGTPITPLSLGIRSINPGPPRAEVGQDWVLMLVAFENILASYGASVYESIWYGSARLSEDELEPYLHRLADDLRRLGRLVGEETRSWQEAAADVGEGRALLTVGGDWMRAQVDPSTLQQRRVVTVPFPGTEATFVYTPDSFAVPSDAQSDGSAARRWLHDVADDLSTQLQFARIKQAIPARSGLGEDDLALLQSDYLKTSYLEFADCDKKAKECRMLLAVSGLGPAPNVDPCFDRLGRVLAMIAGMRFIEPEPGTQACARAMPGTSEDAEQELLHLLLGLARSPFREECRPAGESG